MKKLLVVLLVLVLAGALVYCFVINKPHKDVNDEKAVNIDAVALFTEYSVNEQAANARYLNKAIEVSGTIATVDENQDKQKYIILQTEDPLNGIMCTMRSNDFTAKTGDKVAVRGFCSGFVGDVKLTDCVLRTSPM